MNASICRYMSLRGRVLRAPREILLGVGFDYDTARELAGAAAIGLKVPRAAML
ncbi:hypothetical protein AB0H42_02925 [Nocardia sp. NPDC050799]|uniref:hypothetical protein n=1 Tax=Nocardia sp. NPDC050799 TaxID=3154842 RepID=UPI0033E43FEF